MKPSVKTILLNIYMLQTVIKIFEKNLLNVNR